MISWTKASRRGAVVAVAMCMILAPLTARAETFVWEERQPPPQVGPNRIPIGIGPSPSSRSNYAPAFDG